MDNRVSAERLWFSNALLLGFDAVQNEKKYRISFSYDMFKNPNVKGMEIILQFLLSQLYPKRLSEALKFIWPINDQSQAKQFTQVIVSILQELKDKLDLPPVESLVRTCSGKRFYDLLWKLSQHALQNTMQKEFSNYEMPHLATTDINTTMPRLLDMITATKLHIARQSRKFVSHAQHVVTAQENWRRFDKQLYDEHATLTDELAAVNRALAELGTKFDLARLNDAETQEKRKSRIENVRQMWKIVEELNSQVTKNKEIYDDIISGKAYPHQLNAADLHIDKIPDDLASTAGPLLLLSESTTPSSTPHAQFSLDGLITLYTSALSALARQLPPASALPITNETSKLSQWAKTQVQQQAAVEAFEAELTNQVVGWRKELQETIAVRDTIDSALYDRTDDRFKMQALPPPTSYFAELSIDEEKEISPKELGFASPASRAPRQDVLEKLANSVKRVALRGSRTFAAIANELLSPGPVSDDFQNLSISTMSSIDPDTFFAPATPASALQQSNAKRRKVVNTGSIIQRNPRPSIMDSEHLYGRPSTSATPYQPPPSTKPKPFTKPTAPSNKHNTIEKQTPNANPKDGSALNLSSIFAPNKQDKPTITNKKRPPVPKPTTTRPSVLRTNSPPKKSTQKKTLPPKQRPSAMDLLVDDLASFMSSEPDSDYFDSAASHKKEPKPKPSGLRNGPSQTPKKLAWAENPEAWHSYTDPLAAMEGTAFQTTKQLPRTPLPHERSNKPKKHTPHATTNTQDNKSPTNFFDDNNSPSILNDDLEWGQFINNNHTKPTTSTPNGVLKSKTPRKTPHNMRNRNIEMPVESMEFDFIGSPMHMSDWLANNQLANDTDELFPSSPADPHFSNNHAPNKPNTKPKPFIPSNTPNTISNTSYNPTFSDGDPWE